MEAYVSHADLRPDNLVCAGKMIPVQAGKIILTFLGEVTEAKAG